MKKIFFAFCLMLAAQIVMGQKTVNDANAEVRNLSGFHAVNVSSSFEVILTQGSVESVAVSANDAEDIPYITTVVDNGVLKIGFENKKKWWPKNRKLRAYVSVKNIDKLTASGAVKIVIDAELTSPALTLNLSGASNLTGKINVQGKLDVNISGASDLDLTGSAGEATVDASGASDMSGYDFTTNTCAVDASGASKVQLTVDKELTAKLSGASKLNYKGAANITQIKTSGASSISKKS